MAIVFPMAIYQRIIPAFIGLMAINWLVQRIREGWRVKTAVNIGVWFVALYVLYGLGLLWTTNLDNGFFDMEVKLSFLVLPIILCWRKPMSREHVRWVVTAFIAGILVAIIICNSQSLYHYFTSSPRKQGSYWFFDKYYSVLMHWGYFAMMINTALSAILCYLIMEGSTLKTAKKAVLVILLMILSFSVIQTGSKNGILTLMLLYVIMGIWWTFRTRRFGLGVLGSLVIIGGFLLTLKLSDRVYYRFEKMWEAMQTESENTTIESTALRTYAWESALEVISEHPLTGVGTGDVKQELLKKYAEKGYTGAIQKNMNAHNQFLQTTVALGVAGLILLLVIFVNIFTIAKRENKALLGSFAVIMFVYATSESILEVQSGVVFLTFFALILSGSEKVFYDVKRKA